MLRVFEKPGSSARIQGEEKEKQMLSVLKHSIYV